MKKIIVITLVGLLAALGAACSGSNEATTNRAAANTAPAPTTANSNASATASDNHGASDADIPASVRAVFPDAQSITKQHKDISSSQAAAIEKESGSKLPDTDHHSYLAFSTTGGIRKQIGAATIVKAGGKDVVVVYESREGMPYIKEVRAEGVAQGFLDQFKGKGHDDKFQIGSDLKAQGVDEATAKAIASAVRVDILTMQTLYGAAHSH
jgi:hypothetical protein